MAATLNLAFDLHFEDLYRQQGLATLDARFIDWLKSRDTGLHNRLVTARAQAAGQEVNAEPLTKPQESQLLIDLAPHLDAFIAALFSIEKEATALADTHLDLEPLYRCKRLFVQRKAAKTYKAPEAATFDGTALESALTTRFGEPVSEDSFTKHVLAWMDDAETHADALDEAARYAAWALRSEAGKKRHGAGVLFREPGKPDPDHLVPVETEVVDGVTMLRLPDSHHRHREGFALTDNGATLRQALDDAHYCIYCHDREKDSCSKGLKDRKTEEYQQSPHGVTLAGCPLEEHISEMNLLKSQGVPLGALAVVTINNPMAAGTGHRICNDCMKSCIYQKQDPVNIPQVETRTLKDVLHLPWGFEIYSLLTRWNPLNLARPLPRQDSGYKVLVAGMGPAGYTLAHHLLNDGHTVVGIDGLKIEPLAPELSGITATGGRTAFQPIHDIATLLEPLGSRTLAGFGGVAEYGITVRWDKNFLKIIRLLLERREQFALFSGVRFGSALDYTTAFDELGFDHIALAMGAGRPTVISMPNALARGVRTASDFLMALQLTGAAKQDSIANLQLRLPVVVIGGGLTAIDTATESLAYYPVQVEKFLQRYETLVAERGEKAVRAAWDEEETEIAEEFISHARALREERTLAEKENRLPNFLPLLNRWGGVRVAYRRTLQDSPSYRLNHEEVEKAMEEGIGFVEKASPTEVIVDQYQHACGLKVSLGDEEKILPARSIFMAAGTNPNTVLQREDPEHFSLDGKYFAAIDETGVQVTPEPSISKPSQPHVLMARHDDARFVSFFGDLHPSYVGNVVKAMGSAKQGYPVVSKVLTQKSPANTQKASDFLSSLADELVATVHDVKRLTPTIIEVVVRAPLAARAFKPGQFYRLQNYEAYALKQESTTLGMEGLALTGAWVDRKEGLLSTIVLEMGGSSDLCALLAPGEPVVLMGPTGTPTETPAGETVLLAGGGLGNAVLFSIGKALRDAGSRVLYFAGYKNPQDRYKVEEIEAAADLVIWCCDTGKFDATRPQDRSFSGNIVEAMKAYQTGQLGDVTIGLPEVNRIIAIGSDGMMAAVAHARHDALKEWLNPQHVAIGSINSPMQCMMKEICAQCLQKHVDPETGKESYVYSCFNQDQCLDEVNFPHLRQRLRQNTVQEKLTRQWIDHTLRELGKREQAA